MGTREFDQLYQASEKLKRDVEGKVPNLSQSLSQLSIAFDQLHEFFLTSNISTTPILEEIKKILVDTYKTLKLVKGLDDKSLKCDSTRWNFFVGGLDSFLTDDCGQVIELINKFISNIQDIEMKKTSLPVDEIEKKNELYSKNRQQITGAIQNMYSTFHESIQNLGWY